MAQWPAIVGLVALASGAGCSLLVDTSGLSTAAPEEAGAPADASVDDAPAVEVDGGSDGGSDDGGDAGPCGGSHLFCDDFDQGTADLSARWSKLTVGSGSTVALDTSRSTSPPRALHVVYAPGDPKLAFLEKSLTFTSAVVDVSFAMFVDVSGDGYAEIDYPTLVLFPPPPGFTSHALTVPVYPTKSTFEYYQDMSLVHDQPIGLAFGRWQHVTIHFGAPPVKASLTIDGVPMSTLDINNPSVSPTSIDLQLGLTFLSGLSAVQTSVWFDDVVVDQH